MFPISDAIYIETSKISQYRQRHNLRLVIEELSRYQVISARHVIAGHEVEAMLDDVVGPNPTPVNTLPYLDWGVLRGSGPHRDTTRAGQRRQRRDQRS